MIVSHENFNLIRHGSIKMIIEFDKKILTSINNQKDNIGFKRILLSSCLWFIVVLIVQHPNETVCFHNIA